MKRRRLLSSAGGVDYSHQYLTFIALEDGTFSLKKYNGEDIEYSLDDGATWTSLESEVQTPTVHEGERIMWRKDTVTDYNDGEIGYFLSTGRFDVEGNVMSILYKDNFIGQDDLSEFTYVFYELFNSCLVVNAENLILPATTLSNYYCYGAMFRSCSYLEAAPELPATTLGYYCYYEMFYNCYSLRKAPSILPALTLAEACYYEMFYNCEELLTAPVLPAETMVEYCYYYMFYCCYKLNYIKCLATNGYDDYSCCEYWTYGVGGNDGSSYYTHGVFIKADGAEWYIDSEYGIPEYFIGMEESSVKDVTELSGLTPDATFTPAAMLMFTAEDFDSAVGLKYIANNQTMYVSGNGTQWYNLDTTKCYTFGKGKTLYVCGMLSGDVTISGYDYTIFAMGGSIAATGNGGALWNYSNPSAQLYKGCGYYMFEYNTALTLFPVLPATTLAESCYRGMFYYCVRLKSVPTNMLPATTLAMGCYEDMFYQCTSLTTVSQLPATILAEGCYQQMFYGCTSLTTAPITLPATTLAESCYEHMFDGCTSLTTAPALPATTLIDSCYSYMFSNCTSLITAPTLPATTLANNCYESMFWGCTSLITAPELPATTLAEYCYYQMFYGCTSLTSAPTLPATTLATYCYTSMFQSCTSLIAAPTLPATTLTNYCYFMMFSGCSSLTTAPTLPATTLTFYCYNSMFSGCTSLTTAPSLPATTLADYCYYLMFNGCTSLTTAPELPATTLATNCYNKMFYGCISLNYVKCLATTRTANDCTSNWLYGVASNGTFVRSSGTNWSSGNSGIPSGWTIVNA